MTHSHGADSPSKAAEPFIHPTAVVEDGVEVGRGTAVWHHVHVRAPTRIGRDCIIGGRTTIAYGVQIGNRVKINSNVYICTGIRIEDRVMISAGVTFTNDRFPRAFDPDNMELAESGPTEATLESLVGEGATLGAGAVIGPGLSVGRFAMVGMGSVVTADVAPHALVYGNPARLRGWVCVCGKPLDAVVVSSDATARPPGETVCLACRRRYKGDSGVLVESA